MSTVERTPAALREQPPSGTRPRVSVVIPCLNEAETIEECVSRALGVLEASGLPGEVIVADNGSEDGSAELAAAPGAHVVHEPRRGYGSAYLAGFAAAQGDYIVMADADLTYDFGDIPRFVGELDGGAEMVIGDRMDNIQPGAMPWLHRYVGNPILTRHAQRLLPHRGQGRPLRDARVAPRRAPAPRPAHDRDGVRLGDGDPRRQGEPRGDASSRSSTTRAAASRSSRASATAGATCASCSSTARRTSSSCPGAVLSAFGVLAVLTVLAQIDLFGRTWDLHAMIAGALLMIVGVQVLALGLCAHAYGTYFMGEQDPWFDRMRARFRLEHGLLLGGAIGLGGLVIAGVITGIWIDRGFGELSEERLAVLAAA